MHVWIQVAIVQTLSLRQLWRNRGLVRFNHLRQSGVFFWNWTVSTMLNLINWTVLVTWFVAGREIWLESETRKFPKRSNLFTWNKKQDVLTFSEFWTPWTFAPFKAQVKILRFHDFCPKHGCYNWSWAKIYYTRSKTWHWVVSVAGLVKRRDE